MQKSERERTNQNWTLTVQIDSVAYSNGWRRINPAEKGIFALLSIIATLLAKTPHIPITVSLTMIIITIFGAKIPLRNYLRISLPPLLFLSWSCILLAVSFSGGGINLVDIPQLQLSISYSKQSLIAAELTMIHSFAAILTLLFLVLTTPMTEIMQLLRHLKFPKLLIELMTITYRQIFIFFEIISKISAAQKARLGYSSNHLAIKSVGGLAGNILMKSFYHTKQNHHALLARGYDSELLFLSPKHTSSLRNLVVAIIIGGSFILSALVIKP